VIKDSLVCTVKILAEKIKFEFDKHKKFIDAEADLDIKFIDNSMWLNFNATNINKAIEIPLPSVENGITFIIRNNIKRAVSKYWIEQEQKLLSYMQVIETLLIEDVSKIFPTLEGNAPIIPKITRSFVVGNPIYTIMSCQQIINTIINTMPLHETDMNSWAMNNRIIVIDPKFESITDPNERLKYQVEKNKKYYKRFNWTAIGISDGSLADKNYLLDTDLRKFTPFGMYHNPQRNLYSTLCLKGDELPRIRTKSMQKLIDVGISRHGWNLVTAILDTPLTFEDQILVDNRLKGLSHTVERKFTIYGTKLMVNQKDEIKYGDIIGFNSHGEAVIMNLRCDKARVVKVSKSIGELDNEQIEITTVVIEGKRFLRDGSKLSNLHGNKGIIRFADLGTAIDPRTGEEVNIDIMISGQSINKRRNFGQLLEMMANNVNPGTEPIVIEDNYTTTRNDIQLALEKNGFPVDGSWIINTYCGEFQAVTGKMFWGVAKDAEDQVWDDKQTNIVNNKGLRISGLKFSHVELKALVTRFGPKNPVVDEILSYAQGAEILRDEIRVLQSATGLVDNNYITIDAKDVMYVNTDKGFLHDNKEIAGTIVDDSFFPDGFLLRLPCFIQAVVNKDDLEDYSIGVLDNDLDKTQYTIYQFNTIFIPNSLLRRCWKHASGKWGLSVVGNLVNRIVHMSHEFINNKTILNNSNLAKTVAQYFITITKMMGTKSGDLSIYGMAVRYPFSIRLVASLADNLPPNTIEIHRDSANKLKVKNGDVVLVERFPCLGFMSIRPQKILVTDDPQCKYTVRVSGNSLVSLSLDFDGDTLFIASFHTAAAKDALRKEFKQPNEVCINAINKMNSKKVPFTREMTFDDFNVCLFPKPTNEEHAELVRRATGVKSHTGPVIALAYNLMRIVERNVPYSNVVEHANIELLLDFLGNTVFKQKHGIKSLQEEATDAICTANVEDMVRLGFDKEPSELLCSLIVKEASKLGIHNLKEYHEKVKQNGGSKIINLIVRKMNKIYFATRAQLGPFALLEHLSSEAADLPSYLLKRLLKTYTESAGEKLDRIKAERMKVKDILTTTKMKKVYEILSGYVDQLMTKSRNHKTNFVK